MFARLINNTKQLCNFLISSHNKYLCNYLIITYKGAKYLLTCQHFYTLFLQILIPNWGIHFALSLPTKRKTPSRLDYISSPLNAQPGSPICLIVDEETTKGGYPRLSILRIRLCIYSPPTSPYRLITSFNS